MIDVAAVLLLVNCPDVVAAIVEDCLQYFWDGRIIGYHSKSCYRGSTY